MNIVKLQDIKLTHRSLLHSYTLTMRKQKEKLRKQYHSPLQDFGSSLLSLFCILLQAGSLSPPVLFVLVGTYRVPLPAEYFSAFSSCLDCCVWGGHTFCMLEVVLLFIVEFLPVNGVG